MLGNAIPGHACIYGIHIDAFFSQYRCQMMGEDLVVIDTKAEKSRITQRYDPLAAIWAWLFRERTPNSQFIDERCAVDYEIFIGVSYKSLRHFDSFLLPFPKGL